MHFVQGLVALLPAEAFIRLRPRLYRLAGIRIGHGTVMSGRVRLTGAGAIARIRVILGQLEELEPRMSSAASGEVGMTLLEHATEQVEEAGRLLEQLGRVAG